jgi:hypothetical protein
MTIKFTILTVVKTEKDMFLFNLNKCRYQNPLYAGHTSLFSRLSLFLVSSYSAVFKVQSGSSSQSLVRNELNFNSYPLFSHARVFIIFPKHIILLNVDKIVILCITSRIDVCFYWFNCALLVELMCLFIGLIVHYRCEKIWPNFLTWGKLWDTSLRS